MSLAGVDLCQIPALEPPEGTLPNFVDPPSLSSTVIGVSSTLTAVAILFVLGRLYMNIRRLTIADAFVTISLLFSIGYYAVIFGLHNYFRHQWDLPACWFTGDYMKWNFVQGLLLPIGIAFSKAAILLLLRQLFGIYPRMRLAVNIGLVADFVIYGVSLILVPYYQAPHIGETWDDLLVNRRPWQLVPTGAEQGSLALLLDVYIFILPLPVLSSIQLQSQRRLKLFCVFGTAFMGVIASILALVYRVKLLQTSDGSWAQAQVFICIMVENYVALIVACMPAFAHFLQVHVAESTLFKSLASKYGKSSSEIGSGGSTSYPESQKKWTSSYRANNTHSSSSSQSESRLDEHASPYYALNDTPFNSRGEKYATVQAQGEIPRAMMGQDRGIMRTFQVDQTSQHRDVV